MPTRSVIVLAIDGLRASALGAYGNTWRPTPGLDRLAAESLIVEWAFRCEDSENFFSEARFDQCPWALTHLVTDDPGPDETTGIRNFTNASIVKPAEVEQPAKAIDGTQLADTFALFADAIAQEDFEENSPASLTWLHCRGLAGPWDAPTALVNEPVEEDDPTPEVSIEPAAGVVDRATDPDAIFGAMCRYAAQVAVLDACLESWLDWLDEIAAVPPWLIVVGTRGYALGEHGAIGLEEAGPYSESRHVPLLIRPPAAGDPAKRSVGFRWGNGLLDIAGLPQIAATLAESPPEFACETALIPTGKQSLCLAGQSAQAVRTEEWLLVRDNRDRLFAKPDDRWEANDVASLKPEVVEELGETLDKSGR